MGKAMNVWADVAMSVATARAPLDDMAARLRVPRRIAYGALALLACPAVALGHDQWLASIAAVYLLVSPMVWHARAAAAPSGWIERRLRGRRPPAHAAASVGAAETLVTGGCVLALLPLPLGIVAVLALVLVRVAVAGANGLGRFVAALLLGVCAGAVLQVAWSGDAFIALAWSPVLLACALAWLAGVTAAIAWLGHEARCALGVAVAEGQNSRRACARLAARFGRYLAPGVRRALHDAEGVAADDLDVDLLLDVAHARRTPARRWLTVCFADIVGFTRLTERLEPEEIAALLDGYQREMALVVAAHGGTVDKFMGDGILVLFGDLEPRDRAADAAACVAMALAMRSALPGLNAELRRAGLVAGMQLRWGIASGTCTVGDFGSDDRLHYTALGRTVNLASRLENAAAPGEILLSERTRRLVDAQVACTAAGPLRLPGIDWSVNVFRALDHVPADTHAPAHGDGKAAP